MDCFNATDESPYGLLLKAASLIPVSHYLLAIIFFLSVIIYPYLELHFLQDLFTGFRGQPVVLTFNANSHVYQEVASKCKTLHGRYLSTPWLCSPHLQTPFLAFFGRAPVFNYTREIFKTSDGGTIALDWLMNTDVKRPNIQVNDAIRGDSRDPIMVVIPGLASDSDSACLKHIAFETAKRGWNAVVSNHRGLGGVPITSNRLYDAAFTDDIREVIVHLHHQYPKAPLFTVGTSIGANILVKYLGEDGANIPIVGAAAICSPWDFMVTGRFITRGGKQSIYNKTLATGLKDFAQLHQNTISRLADWEGIQKASSIREYDIAATRVFGKYETVDTYYRKCSSTQYVEKVKVPLLCISALDDPVCTWEAIPFDECRENKYTVLATTEHGGHLAYFEGLTAKSIWWVKAVNEFFSVLLSSSLAQKKKELQVSSLITPQESSLDQSPYVNIQENGKVAAIAKEPKTHDGAPRTENGEAK